VQERGAEHYENRREIVANAGSQPIGERGGVPATNELHPEDGSAGSGQQAVRSRKSLSSLAPLRTALEGIASHLAPAATSAANGTVGFLCGGA